MSCEDVEPDDLFEDGPTKAQVDAMVRRMTTRQAAERMQVRIAEYRAKYPNTTAQDYIVAALIEMADSVGREP